MTQLEFELTYDGPLLDGTGAMPVRDVAKALESLDAIIRAASLVAFPSREPAGLAVRGSDEGSLVLRLVVESGWEHLVDIFGSDDATAMTNLFGLVGGASGIFAFIRKRRNRQISEEISSDDARKVTVVFEDGERVTVPVEVLELHRNLNVRKRTRDVVEPLHLEGVEEMRFVRQRDVTVELTKADVTSFDPPPVAAETVSDTVLRGIVVSIASPSFTENKWRLDDGASTFAAALDDTVYRADVEAGRESFRAGDHLKVDLRVIQTQTVDTIHLERRVVRVLEHIPRSTQLRFVDSEHVDDGGRDAA